ncbi:MAG TPA: Arm DNA-binding domain-containing protein, partial [Tepidisphaeraceae bacterium]|nr:Arm DNA-binding domain-containing protein [Tepidisphaeraceae bacterium]
MTSIMRLSETAARPMARKINFSVRTLAAIQCPQDKAEVWVYDLKMPGLAYRVTSNDVRAFYLYQRVNGPPRKIRIGDGALPVGQARKIAATMRGQIAQGVDPSE